MLEAIQKLVPGQIVGPFEVMSIAGRDSRDKLPLYNVRCTRCLTPRIIKHRAVVLKCAFCELQTTREALAQSPALTAKLQAVKAYEQSVERLYEQSKKEPASVPTPAPIQPPQPTKKGNFSPSKPLSRTARIVIQDLLAHDWTDEAIRKGGFEDL